MTLNRLFDSGQPLPTPDVQQTTLSIDVMGRYVCNLLSTEALSNRDFDAIVIGAGMYGGYCAAKIYRDSRLAGQTPLRVLVLEAGPFLVWEHNQNIPDLGLNVPGTPAFPPDRDDRAQPQALVWGVGWRSNSARFPGLAYCVGGKSLFWGGWCPRLTAEDLKNWPNEARDYLTQPPKVGAAAQNHPSVYEAVEFEIGAKPTDDFIFDPVAGPNAPKTEAGLNEALNFLVATGLAKLNAAAPPTPLKDILPPPIAVQTQSFISGLFALDKFSSLPGMVSAIRDDPSRADNFNAGIFLVPRAHVCRLIAPPIAKDGAMPSSYRVQQIELFANGTRQFIDIKPTCVVVLALSAIESTRLALESFPTAPQRPQRNGNDDELMGRNLMAHLRFDFPFTLDRQKLGAFVQQKLGRPLGKRLQTASLHVQAFGPHGRFHLQVYAASDPFNNPDKLIYRMIPDPDVAQTLLEQDNPKEISVIFRVCGEMQGSRTSVVGAPNTSWINLASEADRDRFFDHRRAWVQYASHDADGPNKDPMWQDMYQAAVALAREMGATKIPDLNPQDLGSTFHDAGTLWMGTEPDQSVTDVNGHFHHMSNAYCVDQALFPTIGSANPVLTGLCLARKTAESIVQRSVTEPDLTPEDIQSEKAGGFRFLLPGPLAVNWKANDRDHVARPSPLIVNGTILEVEGGKGLAVLFYDEPAPFRNFVLRLQWKAFLEPGTGDINANSGVFLRTPLPPGDLTDENFYNPSIEIQIDETGYDFDHRRFRSSKHKTGAIYKIASAQQWAAKVPSPEGIVGYWNSFEITARDQEITVFLNGKLVCIGIIPATKQPEGFIGLQYHTGKVQFRNIRVKTL